VPPDAANSGNVLTLDQIRLVSDAMRERRGIERAFVFLDGADSTEFLSRAAVAEWLLGRFPKCKAAVAFRNVSPERAVIVECAPSLGIVIDAEADSPAVAPVEWFDIGVSAPIKCDDPAWIEHDLSRPDLVLLPSMLPTHPCRIEGFADNPPLFDVPPPLATVGMQNLAERNYRPERWFVCIETNLDRRLSGTLSKLISDDLGGASVPLDDMLAPATPVAENGQRDAIKHETMAVHLAAIIRSRFVLSGNPFHLGLASALQIPLCAVGVDSWAGCVWNDGDIVLPSAALEKDGTLIAGAIETLMERTKECTGWRPPIRRAVKPVPGSIALPLASCNDIRIDVRD
jgi:hypothetical protein